MAALSAPNRIAAGWLTTFMLAAGGCHSVADNRAAEPGAVSYEAFGAVGDGVTDDLPAIIQANTAWNPSRFIIDDVRSPRSPSRQPMLWHSACLPSPASPPPRMPQKLKCSLHLDVSM